MRVEDLEFLEEDCIRNIECEVIISSLKANESEQLKEKDGRVIVENGDYIYRTQDIRIKFKINDELKRNKVEDMFRNLKINISKIAMFQKEERKFYLNMYFFNIGSLPGDIYPLINEDIAKKIQGKLKISSKNKLRLGELEKNFIITDGNQKFYTYFLTEEDNKKVVYLYGSRFSLILEMKEEKIDEREIRNYLSIKELSKKNKTNHRFITNGFVKFMEEKKYIQESVSNVLKNNDGSYLKIWSDYTDMEGQLLFKKVLEVGEIKIRKIIYKNEDTIECIVENEEKLKLLNIGDRLKFSKGKPEYLIDIPKNNESNDSEEEEEDFSVIEEAWKSYNIEKENKKLEIKEKREEYIEEIRGYNLEIEKIKEKSIILKNLDYIPINKLKSYNVSLSFFADEIQMERRKNAKERIMKAESANMTLGLIINGQLERVKELSEYSNKKEVKKIDELSARVREKIFKNEPTPNQREAISIALNTPDIAVIQGPPGTGKTTVITAIIERLNELSDKNLLTEGQVLVTSFQHDAVENVIERIRINSLPTIKFGSRNGEDDYLEREIEKWTNEISEKLIAKNPEIKENDEREKLRDLYANYIDIPNQANAVSLLKECEKHALKIVTKDKITKILENYKLKDKDNYEDYTVANVRRLYTTKEGILDRGKIIVNKILTEIGEYLEKNKEYNFIYEFLNKYKNVKENEIDEEFLNKVKKIKKNLLKILLPTPVYEKDKINLEITATYNLVIEENRKTSEGLQSTIYNFYKEITSNPDEVIEALKKYCYVYAATTQQSEGGKIKEVKKKNLEYDVVIIDEAARVSPADLMIPMCQAKQKIILVGDHRQLPHVYDENVFKNMENINSEEEAKAVKNSMFEYLKERALELEKLDGIKRTITLDRQYRMHPLLGNFVSNNFYKEYGEEFSSPLGEEVFSQPFFHKPLIWINLRANKGNHEKMGTSYKRICEAEKIVEEIERMILNEKDKKYTYGVISFYKGQVDEIKNRLKSRKMEDRVMVGSVDSFQGREFDVMFLSIVRSYSKNDKPKFPYGFLTSENRLCVSLSRQKKLLVVIGNADIFSGDWFDIALEQIPAMKNLYELCLKEGEIING